MKGGILALLIIGSFGISVRPVEDLNCPQYKCTSKDLGQSICANSVNIQGRTVIQINECSHGYECDISNLSVSGAECVQPSLPPTRTQENGMKCIYNSDCYSDNCEDGVCKSKTAPDCSMTGTDECDPGYYCNPDKVCKELIQEGQNGCETNDECAFGTGCYFTSPTNSTCTKMFSLSNGTGFYKGSSFNYLCSSGFAIASSTTVGEFTCSQAPVTSTGIPRSCSQDSDCVATIQNNDFGGSCDCGYNSKGASYCSIYLGDEWGQKYLNKLKKWISKDKGDNCNALYRYDYECMLSYWSKSDAAEFRYYLVYYRNYNLFYDSLSCARVVYGHDEFEEVYEAYKDAASALWVSAAALIAFNMI